ncbi:Wzz/FepE/Etk N-terminal domain-containing protein [Micromonospora sp. NBC_01699]|uniref:Wzz/FepE/Etk N-terminal domain-containing protein n=1 Tax=Micromonospora sp. NBC_01699 TaxID=2975984 RepID=UPI002E2BA743|nr:Wzz/FepE/Etk N-terminal domain-containing protein [Micromonospora sp. NBC_01699]
MDLLDLLKLMFRRWYVTIPVVVLTLAAAFTLSVVIQPEYKTSAAVLLVPPTTSPAAPASNANPQPGNPWLRVGENAMAQAVQISISAHEARTKVEAAGGNTEYEVGLVNRSPILTIDVTAASHGEALATVTAVTKLIGEEVAGKQAEYKPKAGEQITTQVLDPGLNIVQSRSNVLRAQIVVIAIGLLLAAASSVGYDAIVRRRNRARLADRHGARPSMAWNAGQATVGSARRPTPGPKGSLDSADATQVVSNFGAPVHPASNSGAGDRSGGVPPQISADFVRAPQSDDTILLTAVRRPTDDTGK